MDELKRIKKDLLRILIFNIIIFGSYIILYLYNQKTNFLQNLAEKYIK